MGFKYYLTKSNFIHLEGFIPHVIVSQKYSEERLVHMMSKSGTTLTSTDLKAVLMLLKQTIISIILEGGSVTLDDFVKFSPTINGHFSTTEQRFNKKNHKVGVVCTVLKGLKKIIHFDADVTRGKSPVNMPYISYICTPGDNQKVLRRFYSNRIRGQYFTYKGLKLAGMGLLDPENKTSRALFSRDDLVIDTLGGSEMGFSFSNNASFPGWLRSNRLVDVQLQFSSPARSGPVFTGWYRVMWVWNE